MPVHLGAWGVLPVPDDVTRGAVVPDVPPEGAAFAAALAAGCAPLDAPGAGWAGASSRGAFDGLGAGAGIAGVDAVVEGAEASASLFRPSMSTAPPIPRRTSKPPATSAATTPALRPFAAGADAWPPPMLGGPTGKAGGGGSGWTAGALFTVAGGAFGPNSPVCASLARTSPINAVPCSPIAAGADG